MDTCPNFQRKCSGNRPPPLAAGEPLSYCQCAHTFTTACRLPWCWGGGMTRKNFRCPTVHDPCCTLGSSMLLDETHHIFRGTMAGLGVPRGSVHTWRGSGMSMPARGIGVGGALGGRRGATSAGCSASHAQGAVRAPTPRFRAKGRRQRWQQCHRCRRNNRNTEPPGCQLSSPSLRRMACRRRLATFKSCIA